jgi:flagellin-like protein
MIRGCVSLVNRHTVQFAPHRRRDDERAVSEVLGVVMLLAMVITIMGGVWVFLNPYLSDFEDNTNWNSATGLADRIEDRIEVAGNAPEDTGFRNTLAIQSTAIRSVQNVEHWTISADLTESDRINLRHVNDTTIGVLSANETARSITVQSPEVFVEQEITVSHLEVFITHNASSAHWMIITVYDADNEPIHRQVMWTLSGLQITTSLGQGEHQIVLMNNARAERFPNEAWKVSAMPLVEFDRMANDELRLSMLLTDIESNGSIGSGSNVGMQFVSQGPLTLFTGRAYNVNFNVFNALHDVITPQYHSNWLADYTVQRSAGTLDTYIGFSPYERASGADGFSVSSQSLPLYFEVDIQRVEVSR